MEELELGYTPRPAQKRRVAAMPVGWPQSGAAGREAGSLGLAAATATGLALFGAGALLASPRSLDSRPAVAGDVRPFAVDDRAVPAVRVAEEASPVEDRPLSPLPFAGDALGPEPESAVAGIPAAAVSAAPRERHVLISFDGTRTLTDGPAVAGNDGARRAGDFPPAPVVWNNPVRWIDVHKRGL